MGTQLVAIVRGTTETGFLSNLSLTERTLVYKTCSQLTIRSLGSNP